MQRSSAPNSDNVDGTLRALLASSTGPWRRGCLGLALLATASVSGCSSQADPAPVAVGAAAGTFGGLSGSGAQRTDGVAAGGTAGIRTALTGGGAGRAGLPGVSAGARAGAGGSVAGGSVQAGAGTAAGQTGALPAGMGPVSAGAGSGGQDSAGHSAGTAGSGAGAVSAGAGGTAVDAHKKFVGNITTRGQVRDDFAMYWDQITPENEGKWGSVEGTRNQMNWAGLDRIHEYAKSHGLVFKQHTFVWGSQQPGWLGGLSAAEQRVEVEEWIRLFCERYPDVKLIDVVNEPPPHTTPVYLEALGGAGQSGYDWIVQAFKWSRQYCPGAILILNDYNNIEYGNDNSHFIDIVNRVKNAGAPIDAVGAQAHDAYKLPASTVHGFVDKLAATGLPVYITEYDIDLANDAEQQTVMQNQFPMFWQDEHVAGITFWGYVAGATWKPNTGLMSGAGDKRPALSWLLDFLGR